MEHRLAHGSRLVPVFLAVALAAPVHAQTFRGGIRGAVTDATGAAVPGAEVTAAQVGTGLVRTAVTDAQGNYAFSELPLGEWSVTASLTGFAPQTVKGVPRRRLGDPPRGPGAGRRGPQETVEVVAGAPLVDSTSDNQGGTIAGEQASELPVNGRDFTKLLSLVPGTTADPSSINDSPGSFGLFSANGNRGRSNNYLLDGTDMNDGYRNLPAINQGGVFGTPSTVLPVDAVEEFPILSGAEAEYGRNSGAIVNIVTRSGSNTLHGPRSSTSATTASARATTSTPSRSRRTTSRTTSSAPRSEARSSRTGRSSSWPTRDSARTGASPASSTSRPTRTSRPRPRRTGASSTR